MRQLRSFAIALCALCILNACSKDDGQGTTTGDPDITSGGEAETGLHIEEGQRAPVPEGDTPQLVSGHAHNRRYGAGTTVEIPYTVRHWELAQGGNHVHLIFDDHPYIPIYDVSESINLNAVLEANGIELTEGWHMVRAFLSRPTHESVKVGGHASTWFGFFYGEAPGSGPIEHDDPLLTYSRPKGCYAGADAERILLDFQVRAAELGSGGHSVRVTIDGEQIGEPLAQWVPHYIVGLEPGEHAIGLELLDASGAAVEAPFAEDGTIRVAGDGESCP